jgi:hypothetical protein
MPNRQYAGRGEPVNAYVIAMDTAAVTLAALAAGLISAGRRGPRGPFPGLAGSLPCRQEAQASQLHLTFTPGHAAQPHPGRCT